MGTVVEVDLDLDMGLGIIHRLGGVVVLVGCKGIRHLEDRDLR